MVSSSQAANTNRKPVLVVSEVKVNLIVVSRTVESTGMTTVAVTPLEALDVVQQQPFALVVVDGDPGMTAAVSVINRFSAGPHLDGYGKPPIILLSANADMPVGTASGAIDAIVLKPLTQERLEAEVLRLANEARN